MKKLIAILVMLAAGSYATNVSAVAMSLTKKGGFKKSVSNGPDKPVTIKCGTDDDKICYRVIDGIGTVIGDPVKIWVATSDDSGIGYIGVENPIGVDLPTGSTLEFNTTPETITTTNYQEWETYEAPAPVVD